MRAFPLPVLLLHALLVHGCLLVSPLDEPLDDDPAGNGDDPGAAGSNANGAAGSQGYDGPAGGGSGGSGAAGDGAAGAAGDGAAGAAGDGAAGAADDDPTPPAGAYRCQNPIGIWTQTGPQLLRFEQQSGDCPPLPSTTWPLEEDANCATDVTLDPGCGYTETSFCIGYDAVIELRQTAANAPVTGTLSYSGAALTSAGSVDCDGTYALRLDELPAQHTCDPAVDFAGVFRVIVNEPVVDTCGQITPGATDAQYVDPASVTEGCEVLVEEHGPCTYAAAFTCPGYSGAVAMGQELPGGVIAVYFEASDGLGCDVEYGVQYLPADLP